MTTNFRKVRWAAALLTIVMIAAGAGSNLWAGEDEAAGKCLEQLVAALEITEFFLHDLPALRAWMTANFLSDYLFCLKYLG